MAQIGYGAKAKGIAGVATALPQDAFAPITNPASSLLLGCRVDFEIDYVFQHGGTREVDAAGRLVAGTEKSSSDGLWQPQIAAVWQNVPWVAFGVALYSPGALSVDYRSPIPSLSAPGSFAPTALTTYTAALTPYFAVRLSSVHRIGLGVNLLASSFNLRGVGLFATPAASISPGSVTNRGTDLVLGISLRGGWLLCVHKELLLGISFQTKSWSGRFNRYRGFLADRGRMEWPTRLDLGATWWPIEHLAISADYSLVGWSRIRSLGNRGQGEGGLFGTRGGPGFGWNRQSIVRVGLLYCGCPGFAVRLGFNLGVNPIDATQSQLNQLTLAQPETQVSGGFTKCVGRGEVTAFYYYCFRRRVTGRDSDLSGGTNNFETRNTQNGVGVAYGVNF